MIWSEFVGLFVGDERFAVTIVAWLGIAWLVLPRLPLPAVIGPLVLFAGLAALLVESAVRRSR